MYDIFKSIVVEFIGTFILVFIGAGAVALNVVNGGSVVGNALAFGLTYMFLIYCFSNYSSANFNPAISFALALSGRLGWCRMILYWIVQILAGLAAGALIAWIFGINANGAGAPVSDLSFANPWKVVVIEMFLSAFLIFVFLVVTKNPMLSTISGFIIGLTLTALILFGGYFARAGINFAYALGTSVFTNNLSALWIIVLGNLLGALLAVFFYKVLAYPWTCAEIEANGCDQECGKPTFFEEFKDCTEAFREQGLRQFEMNKMELEAMGEPAGCYTPCNMPDPCPKVCEPKCGRMGRKRYVSL